MKNLFIFVLIFFSWSCSGREYSCEAVNDIEFFHNKLWTERALQKQNDLISCISDAWYFFDNEAKVQSAEFTYYASTYLLSALQFNVVNFLEQMKVHPILFEKLIASVKNDLFVWPNDPPCGYIEQLQEIKRNLSIYETKYGNDIIYSKLKSTFDNIECRVIY
jgi:hypothetical protein